MDSELWFLAIEATTHVVIFKERDEFIVLNLIDERKQRRF